jgi:ADP-ribose pyrophosphatase
MGFVSRSQKLLHQWAVWTLVEDHLEDPSGGAFVRTYVDSPGAVGVVVLHVDSIEELKGAQLSDVKTTLVRQFRAPFGQELWEIPAGMRDVADEPSEVTAHRELAEEAGLEASVLVKLGSMASAPGITNSIVEIYAACCLREVPIDRHGPEEEHMQLRVVSVAEALEEVRRGDLTDAKTIIGLQWVKDLL